MIQPLIIQNKQLKTDMADLNTKIIAFSIEQYPLLEMLNDTQFRRLFRALYSTFIDGEVVDLSDDPMLNAFWPSAYGFMERTTKNYISRMKMSEKKIGNTNASKSKEIVEEPTINV